MDGKKVINNASWIIVCRCVQAVLSLIITMFTSRYLGPSNYGLLNYAGSIVAFFTPISMLGINSVLVQELVAFKEDEGSIVFTSLCLTCLSSLGCILGVFLFTFFVNFGEKETIVVCVLYAIMLFFQSMEIIQYWFQAKLLSKYTSIISLIAYLLISFYKIILLATKSSVYWFAISFSLDYMIISGFLFIVYFKKKEKKYHLKYSKDVAKRIFSKSKYYIISSLMVTLFAQQDKIMIKLLLGNIETGYYSAAVTCATMSGFVFIAIIDSVRPLIYNERLLSVENYESIITSLYSIIIYLCVAQGIVFTISARFFVKILYGSAFLPAAVVLQIIIWYSSFSYIGGIRDIWLLGENKQKYLIWINMFGAMLNAIANYLLIKSIGIVGAAVASLLTQIFTNVILSFFIPAIKHNNDFLLKAINPKYALKLANNLLKLIKRRV